MKTLKREEVVVIHPAEKIAPRQGAAQVWIHPVSCLVLIGCDWLWTTVEWAAFLWLITVPVTFSFTALPVFLIQRAMAGDPRNRAGVVALVCGVLAAIPAPIMGTAFGMTFLAVAGFKGIRNETT